MTTNDNSITFHYPPDLQAEYQQLMQTRDSFLRSLSTAERFKLTTSYALLTNAWAQNLTEQLNNEHVRLSEKLASLLPELKNNGKTLSDNIERALKSSIRQSSTDLKNEEDHFNSLLASFEIVKQTWKQDIEQKMSTLKRKEEQLMQNYEEHRLQLEEQEEQLTNWKTTLRGRMTEQLQDWEKLLDTELTLLKVKQEELKTASQQLIQTTTDCENELKIYQTNLEKLGGRGKAI